MSPTPGSPGGFFGALGQAAPENNKRLASYKSAYRVSDPMGMVVSDPFLGGGK